MVSAAATVALGLSASRQRLLDAARGVLLLPAATTTAYTNAGSDKTQRILRCFPLRERHFQNSPLSCTTTPAHFHAALCGKIAAAKNRVYLASLYIGPAANPAVSPKEAELLQALQSTKAPDVKILLDKNRALRPVPATTTNSTISSAEACYRVLEPKLLRQQQQQQQHSHEEVIPNISNSGTSCDATTTATTTPAGIYLLTVLPAWQQLFLENPYNEVAGVFHIKCYIVDDDLILTGANLSEEYFCDRTDRYLWLTCSNDADDADDASSSDSYRNTLSRRCDEDQPESDSIVASAKTARTDDSYNSDSNNLVECYAALVQALCRHADPYYTLSSAATNSKDTTNCYYPPRTTRQELLDSLVEILTVDAALLAPAASASSSASATEDGMPTTNSSRCDPVAAYAVPTFQAPPTFFRGLVNPIPPDSTIIASLTETVLATAGGDGTATRSCQIRLASAYLNLTNSMIASMTTRWCQNYNTTAIHLLTAGSISHGFKPNPAKVGNKGKAWIPAVFDALGRQGVDALKRRQQHAVASKNTGNDDAYDSSNNSSSSTINLWYYQRPGWTFHAKGMWFTERTIPTTPPPPPPPPHGHRRGNSHDVGDDEGNPSGSRRCHNGNINNSIRIEDASSLCAVTHGSGNYGYRSAVCDMESNLILILPNTETASPSSSVHGMFQNDWNQMCDHASLSESEEIQPLSPKLRMILPIIRRFF